MPPLLPLVPLPVRMLLQGAERLSQAKSGGAADGGSGRAPFRQDAAATAVAAWLLSLPPGATAAAGCCCYSNWGICLHWHPAF